MNKPLVTISVLTYNSSSTVLETLESIKAQTYPNLILQIADDCSTDTTVKICERWIAENKERFVKTKIIVPERNTGVSANANRAWDACETEWYKGIAGDDILLSNCIEEYMNYVSMHEDAVIMFSKIECFGTEIDRVNCVQNYFDYSFFELSPKDKLDRLLTKGNCIPAATFFCNIPKIRKTRLRHDERIPMLEDLPLWINAIKAGVSMCFVDETLVKYRVGSGISTSGPSLRFSISNRLYNTYYVLPYMMDKDPDKALDALAKYETELLTAYHNVQNSKPIKLRNTIMNYYNQYIRFWKFSKN